MISVDHVKSDQVLYFKYVQVIVFQYFLKVFKKSWIIGTKFKYNVKLLMGSKPRKGMIRLNN